MVCCDFTGNVEIMINDIGITTGSRDKMCDSLNFTVYGQILQLNLFKEQMTAVEY